MPFPPAFDLHFLCRVCLQEFIQVLLVTPAAAEVEVIVLHLPTGRIADDGVSPVRQFHCQTFDFAATELGFALNGAYKLSR